MKWLMEPGINDNLAVRAFADTAKMEWSASPSRTVWRKRVHLAGPHESGQVTSVVRYEPGSTFPAHDHPDGEEILVLKGIFSDEHGDWPAGTYLLNPQGFRHAPFSDDGCELFVKLRQYPGLDRRHVAITTGLLCWLPGAAPAIEIKPLYEQTGFTDSMRLERWARGARPGSVSYAGGAEIFVVSGRFTDEFGEYGPACWLRMPVGASHEPATDEGCILYIKTGGIAYLRS